jgi:ATP diphosphatase
MINIEDLLAIIAKLQNIRIREDCPGEQNQTLANIAPYTIEEAYEVADAIARQDWDKFRDALGGLLSQILFYAQLAQEQGEFDLTAIVAAAKEKIIQHHPHLFGDQQMGAGLNSDWNPPKAKEQYQQSSTEMAGTLAGISRAQPALTRAIKLQKRAAQAGFDWTSIDPVLEKIAEELGEVRAELSSTGNPDKLQGEIGDLLFACINLARHMGIDPEAAIRSCNDRFERRFRYIEYALCQSGSSLEEASLEEMDRLWEKAKSEDGF